MNQKIKTSQAYLVPGIVRITEQQAIIRKASKVYGVKIHDVVGPRRFRMMTEARFFAMWLLKETTNLSLQSIGSLFTRDHASVLHAVAEFEDRYETNQLLVDFDPYEYLTEKSN